MDRINQYAFYEIGAGLHQLTDGRSDCAPGDVFWLVFEGLSSIKRLLSGDPVSLGVSRSAAQEVQDAFDGMMKRHYKDEKGRTVIAKENAEPIQSWEWNWLRSRVETFEHVFSAEMREATTYYVPRRGIFSTTALVDHADESFPASVLPFIPAKTRDDWKAAGRCLAFNLLSASGFHVARAVEGTLEAYYQLFLNKPGATLRSWHDYIQALEKAEAANVPPVPTKKTLTELNQMRDDYRNPIMHPRVVLIESDARMLFNNGESVIIAMAEEIRAAQVAANPPQPLLTGIAGALVAP